MKHYIKDARLILFATLAAGASVIAAHGSWVFFGYLVDPALAAVFVGVVALGIIGLDAAATLDRHRWRRAAYLAGMVLFLLMETLANYFAAQATFVGKVVEKMRETPGSDLARIVLHEPFWSRMLVVLFLSLASLAVAAFTFAAANRVGQIRASVATSDAERAKAREQRSRTARRMWQMRVSLRELARGANHTVAKLEDMVRRLREQIAERDADVASLQSQLATQSKRLADAEAKNGSQYDGFAAELAERDETIEQLRGEIREGKQAFANEVRLNDKQEDTIAALRAELDQARAELEQRPASVPPTRANVIVYARERMSTGASLNETARELGWTESTLRGWLASATEEVA
jgi:septal ring factor EnvC (AmiA/AmiB activator)